MDISGVAASCQVRQATDTDLCDSGTHSQATDTDLCDTGTHSQATDTDLCASGTHNQKTDTDLFDSGPHSQATDTDLCDSGTHSQELSIFELRINILFLMSCHYVRTQRALPNMCRPYDHHMGARDHSFLQITFINAR
jgi:hypothetical protein